MGIEHCRSYHLNTKSNYLRLLLAKIRVVLYIYRLKFFCSMSPILFIVMKRKSNDIIFYDAGCTILDKKYFDTNFSTSKVLVAEILVIL